MKTLPLSDKADVKYFIALICIILSFSNLNFEGISFGTKVSSERDTANSENTFSPQEKTLPNSDIAKLLSSPAKTDTILSLLETCILYVISKGNEILLVVELPS